MHYLCFLFFFSLTTELSLNHATRVVEFVTDLDIQISKMISLFIEILWSLFYIYCAIKMNSLYL